MYTILIGPRPHWELCAKTQQEYCKRYSIDYYIITKRAINFPFGPNPVANFYFEKLQVLSILHKDYDQIVYLDGDILITPHARNIFELYPDNTFYYGFDESMDIGIEGDTLYGGRADIMDRDPYVTRVLDNIDTKISWGKNLRGKYIYYNMGVMLFGIRNFDWIQNQEKFLSVKDYPNIYDFNDQTYFNTLIQKYAIPNTSIDYSFNRMHLGKRDDNNERYKADFIHYAGLCLYGIEGEYSDAKKLAAVKADYKKLYPTW